MKKLIALVLALALCLGLASLAGCGRREDQGRHHQPRSVGVRIP